MNFNEVRVLQFMIKKILETTVTNVNKSALTFEFNGKYVQFDSYEKAKNNGRPVEVSFDKNGKSIVRNPKISSTEETIYYKANNLIFKTFDELNTGIHKSTDFDTVSNLDASKDYPYLLIKLINLVKQLKIDAPTSPQVAYDYIELESNNHFDYRLVNADSKFNPINLDFSNETEE